MFDVDHDAERAASLGMEVNGFSFEGMDAPGLDYALNRWELGLYLLCCCSSLTGIGLGCDTRGGSQVYGCCARGLTRPDWTMRSTGGCCSCTCTRAGTCLHTCRVAQSDFGASITAHASNKAAPAKRCGPRLTPLHPPHLPFRALSRWFGEREWWNQLSKRVMQVGHAAAFWGAAGWAD